MIELGLLAQPFQEDFEQHHHRVTHSWLKLVWEKAHCLQINIMLVDLPVQPPRERDLWLMQELYRLNYNSEELLRLNRVRLHQQVLYLSDVVDASGRAIDQKYLRPRPRLESWSSLVFPLEYPTPRDFRLWRKAIPQIRALGRRLYLGKYVRPGHKIWEWRYDLERSTLYHCHGELVDIYEPSQFPGARTQANHYSRTRIDQATIPQGGSSTVKEAGLGVYKIVSYTDMPPLITRPDTFLEVLREWGYMWMWEDMRLTGNNNWLEDAIRDNSLIAVTDGSYMRDKFPTMNSCAFILECTKGQGQLTGTFSDQTIAACSYRGELIGLLAIHLLLLSISKVSPDLPGSVHIYLDCLGALNKVKNLPPNRIPSKCRHSDVLKNILVNCSGLSFTRLFLHVSAHQDNRSRFEDLSQPAQLNCVVDFGAKWALLELDALDLPWQEPFPLEAISVFAGREKMTSDTGPFLRYYAH